jgi:hypothetical protein
MTASQHCEFVRITTKIDGKSENPCASLLDFRARRSEGPPMRPSHQTRSTLGHNSLPPSKGDRKVIRFCPHGGAFRRESRPVRWDTTGDSPVESLERYECGFESEEDYRYRMLVNLLAMVVVIVLIVTGSWILKTLVNTTREGYDCYRPGASNRAACYMPPRDTSL